MRNTAKVNVILLVLIAVAVSAAAFLVLRNICPQKNTQSTGSGRRASLVSQPQKEEAAKVVLARVGKEEITESQIDEAINAIPEWARDNFKQGEGKVEFVRQYATTQALYEKAKRLGLDQDAEIRRNIAEITKKLLVQRFLEMELKDKIKTDSSDIQTYYEANKDNYKEEAAATASVIKLSDLKKAQDALRRLEVGADFTKMVQELSEDENTKAKDGVIEGYIEKNGYIPGIDASKETADEIFLKKEGDLVGPVEIKGAYYIFKINSIRDERQKPFEEAKDQVEYDYKNKKVQEQMQLLLKDILQQERVEIYMDRILEQKDEQAKETK